MKKEFRLDLVEAWEPAFWVDQAIQEIEAWATYQEATAEEQIEALLELQELALSALDLGLSPYELLGE